MLGANIFAFRLEKEHLQSLLEQIEHQEKLYPGCTWGWELSVDLVPDGIGYEIRDMQQKVVSLDETKCLTQVAIPDRQNNMN